MGDRLRALAAAAGVITLTGAWVVGGLVTDGFDPVRQSISQLQREGTATGPALTAAFVAFAGGALLVAPVLSRRLGRAPAVVLSVAALATLGAAASPLGEVRGGLQDTLHLAFGSTGYLSLSLLPLVGARSLRGWARGASYALGSVASLCLLATVPSDAFSGALQRLGFGAGHLWLLGVAVAVLRQPQEASIAAARARWPGSRSA